MDRPAHPDCWYGIQDAAERKKIQNRLAQRARRRRRAGIAAPPCAHHSASSSSQTSVAPPSRPAPPLALERSSPLVSMAVVDLSPNGSYGDPFAAEIPPTVFAALWDNGAMMGLSCGTSVPAKSRPVGNEIPEALRPTTLQLTTTHPIWIDRFPFARMRDNFISLSGLIDEEEFLRDLFSMDSFTIKPGKAGWDSTAWSINPSFAEKWGFLFQ